jgi:prepilin-type N-terminal cleavage/methylation domain-containing protein
VSAAKGHRGFTLIEILIAAGIAAAIATVMVAFLITSLQAQARMAVRVDVQEQGMMACTRVGKDLQSTVLAGVSLRKSSGAQPEVLALHPLLGVGSTDPPAQVFSRQLVIYSWTPGQRRIIRQLWPPDPNTPPAPPVPTAFGPFRADQALLLSLATTPSANQQSFGGDITGFNVTAGSSPPLVSPPIILTVSLSKMVKDKPYDYTLTRTLSLRNSD